MTQLQRNKSLVAVIGMGLMGRSIAACLLAAGHHVTGVDTDLEASASVPQRIRTLLVEMAEEALLTEPVDSVMQRFRLTSELSDIDRSELVVESITEDLNVKRELLQRVEQVVTPTCILATNTSAIPVSLMQEGTKHPERILGLHWDEPAHVTRFMEIIPGKATAPEYLDTVTELAFAWGKEPSKLRKEIRGFITNRISYAMFREACYLVDSGVCSVEDVDRSLRNDVGWWIPFAGPFRYMDLMGVAGYGRVMRDLLPDLSSSPEVPKLMREVVESGGRGISNGKGFYQYTPEQAKAWEQKFIEFNYKIRRLTAQYADLDRGVSDT
ncbi:MAG TPA: 3-hydroxyacyl-CoA dehydrogenase family protein [Acidobacteriaceae bacterium]|nr:3-hydroxyacyl-CoA dehydrogenase family protein [Acidobacteriaceae bacterium]